jgi:hypothetical protein
MCGAFTGAAPGLLYWAVTTLSEEFTIYLIAMTIVGLVWGSIMGVAIYAVIGRAAGRPNPNQRLERP